MMYRGSSFIEVIAMCPEGEMDNTHYIQISKGDGMFTVSYCCDPDWGHTFYLDSMSDYERVKFNIMEAIFECEDPMELLDELDERFEGGFADILMKDECDEDCENCENCENNEYVN
jgi:hypothetical protein